MSNDQEGATPSLFSSTWIDSVKRSYKPASLKAQYQSGATGVRPLALQWLTDALGDSTSCDLLLVGLGSDTPGERCAGEYVEVSSVLESVCGANYNLTLVDVSVQALEEARARTHVWIPASLDKEGWNEYLVRSKQEDERGMSLGVPTRTARIPRSLESKVWGNEVAFIQSDIVQADLKVHGPFDGVFCFNVLDLVYDGFGGSYKKEERIDQTRLAVYNMAKDLKSGGFMLIDSANLRYDALADHILRLLDLSVVKTKILRAKSDWVWEYVLLRKK